MADDTRPLTPPSVEIENDFARSLVNQARALGILLAGAPTFFAPRFPMEGHWKSGHDDVVHTLQHPEVLQRPAGLDGVFVFDQFQKKRR
jgi:NTE family protein